MDLQSLNGRKVSEVYMTLTSHRRPYLERAQEASRLTVPSLFPADGDTSVSELEANFNSVGSEIVSALTAKIVLALFPPGQPFFRLSLTPEARSALEKTKRLSPEEADAAGSALDNKLAEAELEVMRDFERLVPRGELHALIEHLVVGGSACLWLPDDDKASVVPLHSYVAYRAGDDYGLVIVRSHVARAKLPPGIAASAPVANQTIMDGGDGPHEMTLMPDEKSEVEVFTVQARNGPNNYVVWQELSDGRQVGIRRIVRPEKRPLMPQTFKRLPREHYGRSLAENYLGDLAAVASYSKSLAAMAAIMARLIVMVDPTGLTQATDVEKCPNAGVISGRDDDVSLLQTEKQRDMAGVKAVLDDTVARLRGAFLSNFATRRQGERVTAEEIRLLANELETAHAGAYSMLSASLQRPLVMRVIERLKRTSPVLAAVTQVAEPQIVTGLEALGRLAEITRIQQWAQVVSSMFGPEIMQTIADPLAMSARVASALGVSTLGIHKTKTQIQREAQQRQQAAMQSQALEAGIKGAAPAAGKAFVESQVGAPAPQGP